MNVPIETETQRLQLWTVYCSDNHSDRFVGEQRIRAESREAAVEDSRYADYAKDSAYSVWASFKCDCGC